MLVKLQRLDFVLQSLLISFAVLGQQVISECKLHTIHREREPQLSTTVRLA